MKDLFREKRISGQKEIPTQQLTEEELNKIVKDSTAEFLEHKQLVQQYFQFNGFLKELRSMPNPKYLQVFCLRARFMYSTDQISNIIGVTPSTVQKYFKKINQLLKRHKFWKPDQGQKLTEASYYFLSHVKRPPLADAPQILLNSIQMKIINGLMNDKSIREITHNSIDSRQIIYAAVGEIKIKLQEAGFHLDSETEIIRLIYEGRVVFIQDPGSQENDELNKIVEDALIEFGTQMVEKPHFKAFIGSLKSKPRLLLVFCLSAKLMLNANEISERTGILTDTVRDSYKTINDLLKENKLWKPQLGHRLTEVTYYILSHVQIPPSTNTPKIVLNPIQIKLIKEIVKGKTNLELAEELKVSDVTINTHITQIKDKILRAGLSAEQKKDIIKLIYEGRVVFIQDPEVINEKQRQQKAGIKKHSN